MTDFQVGDRVSVEGVVTGRDHDTGIVTVRLLKSGCEKDMWEPDLTLIERPRRKLRVGSVWECAGTSHYRYVHVGNDVFGRWLSREFVGRDQTSIDSDPDLWREVPVEELEREAT